MLEYIHMRKSFLIIFISTLVLLPVITFAAPEVKQIVPNCAPNCKWEDLTQLGTNILNFIISLSIIAAAIMFSYAGFLYMSDGGSGNKIADAKKIFSAVVIGIIIILVAFLLVNTLLKALTYG